MNYVWNITCRFGIGAEIKGHIVEIGESYREIAEVRISMKTKHPDLIILMTELCKQEIMKKHDNDVLLSVDAKVVNITF